MEFLKFVFSSFWTFFGFVVFAVIALEVIKTFFDFIVELIHGKQPVVNIPKEAKFVAKEEEDLKKKFKESVNDGREHAEVGVTMEVGDVMVRNAKTGKTKK